MQQQGVPHKEASRRFAGFGERPGGAVAATLALVRPRAGGVEWSRGGLAVDGEVESAAGMN
jgi:hypothetical protein